jgi:hypothetical protein
MTRDILVVTLLLTSACAPARTHAPQTPSATRATEEAPSRPGDATSALACPTPGACPPLREQLDASCRASASKSIQLGSCEGYSVLVIETDPTSPIFTSETRYYDAGGTLVGKRVFVNEYQRTIVEGFEPSCSPPTPVDPCARR